MSSSAQHHKTFCTLEELDRPQIFSMASFSPIAPAIIMEPPFQGNPDEPYRLAVADGLCCSARPRAGSCRGEPAGVQGIKDWKSSDKCGQQAQTAFSEFTPEANGQRD